MTIYWNRYRFDFYFITIMLKVQTLKSGISFQNRIWFWMLCQKRPARSVSLVLSAVHRGKVWDVPQIHALLRTSFLVGGRKAEGSRGRWSETACTHWFYHASHGGAGGTAANTGPCVVGGDLQQHSWSRSCEVRTNPGLREEPHRTCNPRGNDVKCVESFVHCVGFFTFYT